MEIFNSRACDDGFKSMSSYKSLCGKFFRDGNFPMMTIKNYLIVNGFSIKYVGFKFKIVIKNCLINKFHQKVTT